jgi:hypothetical protein
MIERRPEIELRLTELRQDGVTPVYAIKAVHDEFGLSLGEAKARFAQSPAWAAEQAAADVLHQQLIDACRGEGTD